MAGSPERLAVRSVSQTETQKAVMGSLPLKRDLYQKKKKRKYLHLEQVHFGKISQRSK